MLTIKAVDSRGLNRAIAQAAEFSGRTPEVMVGTAGFFVARQTARESRRASTSLMDSQLGATTTPILSTRGKRKGLPLRSGRKLVTLPPGSDNLAKKIILARFYANSDYNQLTNQRWKLDRATFSPGQGVAGFWEKITETAQAMIGRRHGSVAFLASSLIPIIRFLETKVAQKYRRGSSRPDAEVEKHARASDHPLGQAQLDTGHNSARLEGDMLVGLYQSLIADQGNEAMHRWIGPPLQKSVYSEEAKQLAYAAAKEELLAKSAAFAADGVRVV